MDPITALGLAAAVIDFISFSWGIVNGAAEIYRSANGALTENDRIWTVMGDLNRIAEDLSKGKSIQGQTEAERAVKELAEDCKDDSDALLKLLEKLKVQGRKTVWKSVKAKFKSVMSEDEVNALKGRLQDYRSEITTNLVLILGEGQSSISVQLSSIQGDCKDLKTDFSKKIENLRDDLVKAIVAKPAPDANSVSAGVESEEIHDSLADIARMLGDLQLVTHTIPVQHRILRQLIFNDLHSRQTQIYAADSETCGWILENDGDADESDVGSVERDGEDITEDQVLKIDSDRREARQGLRRWLREGQGVLHISGKAGSGKSTLMKFVAAQDSTREELQNWAGTKTLVQAEFYFWSAGASLQKSLPGLYRSLLFEILSRLPELMEEVFPHQWNRFRARPGDRVVEGMKFREDDIEKAFAVLLEKTQYANHKFCFFIDGLDEYSGDDIAHEELAQKLKTWTEGGDIKICASSRPILAYLDIFSNPGNRTIHLHLVNRPSIKAYCLHKFKEDREVKKSGELYVDLIDEIVENASGVFLWAYLVVGILLHAIRNGASHDTLEKKLKETPSKLDELYDNLRKRVAESPTDWSMSNKMLLLAAKNPFDDPLNAIVFSWLDDPDCLENPEFPSAIDAEPYSDKEISRRLELVRKQVNGLTRGLLDVVEERDNRTGLTVPSFHRLKVQFFHRTAKDYLLQSPERLKALEHSFPGFEESLYGRIRLAEYLFGHDIEYALEHQINDHPRILINDQIIDVLGEQRLLFPQHWLDIARRFQIAFSRHFSTREGIVYGFPNLLTRSGWSAVTGNNCRGSFVHFLAFYGFDEFVLSEIAVDEQLKHTTGNLSLLIAAIEGRQDRLAFALLDAGIALDDFLFPANEFPPPTIGEYQDRIPLWVLAATLAVSDYLSSHLSRPLLALLRRLVQHRTDRGDGFAISAVVIRDSDSDYKGEIRESQIKDVQIDDLLLFLENHGERAAEPDFAATPIGSSTFGVLSSLLLDKKSRIHVSHIHWGSSYLNIGQGGVVIRLY